MRGVAEALFPNQQSQALPTSVRQCFSLKRRTLHNPDHRIQFFVKARKDAIVLDL